MSAIMHGPAVVVRADASLATALTAFVVYGVRHLVVVDVAGRCVGMLTDRVVAARWVMEPARFARTYVSKVCESPPPFAVARATLAEAAEVLRRCATDALVVIDHEGRPLGVVTASDLVAVIGKPRPPS